MKKEYVIWTVLALGAIALGIYFRADYFSDHSSKQSFYKKDVSSFFEETTHDIIVYTQETCEACKSTKSFLAENNIEYQERPVENKLYGDEYKSFKLPYTPLILIKPNLIIIGYNPQLVLDNI